MVLPVPPKYQSGIGLPHSKAATPPRCTVGRSLRLLLITLLALFVLPFVSSLAAAPYIEYLYPAGAQQGRIVEITMGGRSLDGAREVWVSGTGVTGEVLEVNMPTAEQIREAQKRDEVAAQTARVRLKIASNAQAGVRDLRIMAKEGLSNRFRFEVGSLPEVLEKEPNSVFAEAQKLPSLPVVVNGQIKNADRDFFRFNARAGQQLVIEVKARAIKPYLADAVPGWFQARVALYDNASNLIAEADHFRFDPDPVLFFKVPKDGEYVVEIWDALSRGRDDLVYRMKIGELPFVTDIFPLGGNIADKHHLLSVRGVNLPDTSTRWNFKHTAKQPGVVPVSFPLKNGVRTNPRQFELGELPEIFEREPNNMYRRAQRATPPVVINGRIDEPGDIDMFKFTAKAGDKLVFDVMARRLDSPLDAKIALTPTSLVGKNAQSDDVKDERYGLVTHHADPRMAHTFAKDGEYFLTIEDTQGKGGPEYAYRLSIAPQQPDFELRVMPDNLSVPAGGNVVVQLKAIRIDGFNGPIRLRTEGLPQGFTLAGAEVAEGKNDATLTLSAPVKAPPGVYKPRFHAEAEIAGKTVKHPVSAAEELMQAFFYYHTVPVDQGYLVVTPAGPFQVEIKRPANAGPLELVLNKEVEIPVRITRNPQAMDAWYQQQLQQAADAKLATAADANRDGMKNAAAKGKRMSDSRKAKQPQAVKPPQQSPLAKLPVSVRVARGVGRSIGINAVTTAQIAPGTTDGVIKVCCTNPKMVGKDGVFIIEGSMRPKGTKIVSLAPALPFKVLPAPENDAAAAAASAAPVTQIPPKNRPPRK